jgi:hypothetical protein
MATRESMVKTDWEHLEQVYRSWWKADLERPLVVLECLKDDNSKGFGAVQNDLHQYPIDMHPQQIAQKIEDAFLEMEYLGDAFPRWMPNCGPGVLAEFLGSRAEYADGSTWFHPIPGAAISDHCIFDTEDSVWENRIASITQAVIDRLQDSIVIGYPDIGGPVDILASLFGPSEVLMGMLENPEAIHRHLNVLQAAWIAYYNRFSKLLDSAKTIRSFRGSWLPMMAPGNTYPLQCDLSIMIGSDSFERYVYPDIVSCCESIPYSFYHLDGPGSVRHLDSLLAIENLKGIQWVPGAGAPEAEQWLDVLRKIQAAGKLCQVYVSPEGAKRICDELGGKGFLLCIGVGGLLTKRQGEACMELLREYL